jgi:superfamily II DNA helicase RecQ
MPLYPLLTLISPVSCSQLSFLKKDFPEAPIVALTATARSRVMEDTMKILGIQKTAERFSAGFDRPNLYFEVRQKPSSTGT